MLSKSNQKSVLVFGSKSRSCIIILLLALINLSSANAAQLATTTPSTNPTSTALTEANFFPGNNLAYIRCDGWFNFTVLGQKQVASRPADCEQRVKNLAVGFKIPGNNPAALAIKAAGTNGQENVSFQQATANTWKDTYMLVNRIDNAWLNNHMDYDSKLGPLITTASGSSTFQTGSTDGDLYGTQDTAQNISLDKYGQRRTAISSKYSTNAEVVSDGACQMVAMPQGPYSITPMKDGSNRLSSGDDYNPADPTTTPTITNTSTGPKNKSRINGNPIQSDVEQILDPAHPFSPRHYDNWKDRTSPSLVLALMAHEYPDMGSGGGMSSMNMMNAEMWAYTYTWVCGAKKFPYAYLFTHAMPPSRDQAYIGGYDYYTEPMNLGGLILVNDSTVSNPLSPDIDKDRDGKFTSDMPTEYAKWYAECIIGCDAAMGIYGAAICPELCKKVAVESTEHELCRKDILPPVTPINHLKMAYNLAPQGAGTAQNPTTPGIGTQGPQALNFLYSENRPGLPNAYATDLSSVSQEYADEGMSFFFANPNDKFGFNMPPMKFWSTGLPANKSVALQVGATVPPAPVEDTGGKTPDQALARLEPWRTVIAGVNRDYLPDESNDMASDTHDLSGQYGGWNELKLYETRCGAWFGLRCLCDYEKNFFRGSSLGYAGFFRPGGGANISNEVKPREQKIGTPSISNYTDNARQPLGVTSVDKTSRAWFNWLIPTQTGDNDRPHMGILGHIQSTKDQGRMAWDTSRQRQQSRNWLKPCAGQGHHQIY